MRAGILAPLRHRDFALLWAGLLTTNAGTHMQQFALGWLVVQIAIGEGHPERAPLYLGIVAAARAIPGIVFGIVAGAVADRTDRRRLIIRNQLWNTLVMAAMAVLAMTGGLTLPAIVAGTVALAVTMSFDSAVRVSVITRLIPRAIIADGIGMQLIGSNSAMILGPLVGGVLIDRVGITAVLGVSVVLGAPVIAALVAMRTPLNDPDRPAPRLTMTRSIGEGFSFVWRDAVFRPLFVLLLFVAVLGRPYQQLLPAFAEDQLHVGALELSWLFAAVGVGSLAGSFLTSIIGSRPRLGAAVVIAAGGFGVIALLFALQTQLAPAILLAAGVGAGQYLHAGLHVTTYQLRTPGHLIGRVIGASQMIPISLMPLGALLLGSLGSVIGVGAALALGGLALAILAPIVYVVAGRLRTYDRYRDEPQAVSESPAR